jgi:cysteine synthase A
VLPLVGAIRGYRVLLTMPDAMSEERQILLRAYGAELELVPGDTMDVAVTRAREIQRGSPDHFMPQQFENPENPAVHRRTTAVEILAQLDGRKPDAFVSGVGTGGTLTGVGEVLRERFPKIKIVAVEPQGSAVLSGRPAGAHLIQGIGAGFVPRVLNREIISEVRDVSDHAAYRAKKALAQREGLFVGISAGAAVAVARDVARELGPRSLVITVLPDSGQRYLSLERYFRDL